MFNGLHYNSISTVLKEEFGCKIVKLSLDGNFTCPNRDGKCGIGGCSFCSEDGSGTFAGSIEEQLRGLSEKWKKNGDVKYIAYFQNHTNTYADTEYLRKLWDDALSHKDVVGLAVATRPDCLEDDILSLLDEYNSRTYLWVELGFQTANENTAQKFNRGYDNKVFEEAMANLKKHGIKAVIHLILGLPGENKTQIEQSLQYVCSLNPFGLKLHMLHLMKNTRMGSEYINEPWPLFTKDEYISLICDLIEIMPEEITIHRLTGDAPAKMLIAPEWTRNKHAVLNGIQQEFRRRGSYQGCRLKKNV